MTGDAALGGRRAVNDVGANGAIDRTRAVRGPGDAPGFRARKPTRPNAGPGDVSNR